MRVGQTPATSCARWCLTALLLAAARPAAAGEAYFALVYGAQRVPNEPNYSHSFATFVRVCGDGPDLASYTLEEHTISWLPSNTKVRAGALCPEPGHNFGLHESLRIAFENNERVSVWGPFRIEPELYYRALGQIDRLDSNKVRYKANDSFRRSDRVSNCIHAVGSVMSGYRLRVLTPAWGETASFLITRRMSPWILDDRPNYDWLIYALGLDAYPLIYRDRTHPRSGGVRGRVSPLLGREIQVEPSYGPSR